MMMSAGEDDDADEDAEEKLPSCMDYVMHFLTLFWKVLFAFVPPTGKCSPSTCTTAINELILQSIQTNHANYYTFNCKNTDVVQ